jgi:2,4-dienoyl-CoA reductase (NADPH2)
LNTEVTPAFIDRVRPDAVVLAVGGKAPALNVPGADGPNVLDNQDMKEVMAGRAMNSGGFGRRLMSRFAALVVRYFYDPTLLRRMLRFNFPFGRRVAILGGSFAGCELGVTLVERGKRVSIIEESKRIGADVGVVHRWVWIRQLREAGSRLETQARVLEIADRSVTIERADSSRETIEADTVVMAGGLQPDTGLADGLAGKIAEVYNIGDCSEPGKLLEATAAGFLAGQKL